MVRLKSILEQIYTNKVLKYTPGRIQATQFFAEIEIILDWFIIIKYKNFSRNCIHRYRLATK